ncbi:MAG: NAD(P)/FAD-dependent oxidoreductase [Saprospiraceae bacterium]|jgi:thioredoxin reductase (NADPH)|nr:NAD(P)/FAD-dependent oxidoreductase [Saprospiraceae bacterium]HRD80263.1 NAD(P)/FAD-dependent oxidoreductase [Saprospiraceae bacterium]HRF41359.1 NAD(P)/FAD-dependent oxidoreductase [Saprospiraceae bacterium]HRJ13487.1 NAD(P)/FAD-dependent oxidoreductase [Saprospiraceae bacterium]HRK84012.1 NAD(P)/FAD-dependent oxidoreductase [Saprospiraceae bacterium]
MIKTDIAIIGAGPVGLFTVFEAGLLQMHCHLIDVLGTPGGQLAEIYPKKPIYDIPGYPSVLAHELVDNLMQQIAPFNPTFTLGERAETLERLEDNSFLLTTNKGTQINAPVVAIAAGLGSFEPRKPPIDNIADFEDSGVEYIVKDPELYRNKRVVIAGGGDSALDWAIYLADVAKELYLVHRRTEFRGAPDSVEKAMHLAHEQRITLITQAQVTGLNGNGRLEEVVIEHDERGQFSVATDHFVPLFGLTPKLGPLENWGLDVDKNGIKVDTFDYQTNVPGVYAIGDINYYPGKLKLILCGFHEATLMCQSAFKIVNPEKKLSFKYTTVTGISGLEQGTPQTA